MVGLVAAAFGVSILVISGSPVGLLAGAGAWALADRSIEHAAFEAERDRALALLAEVEASRQTQLEAAAASGGIPDGRAAGEDRFWIDLGSG